MFFFPVGKYIFDEFKTNKTNLRKGKMTSISFLQKEEDSFLVYVAISTFPHLHYSVEGCSLRILLKS